MERISNRYHLQHKLGAGGMGEVYRAVDRLTGQTVALKRVTASATQLQFKSFSNEEGGFKIALAQEFRTLSSMRHPHIISVLDYGFDSCRQPFFTMELLQNQQNILAAGRNQPLTVKFDLLTQLVQALVYLHRRGIIHRDLKPDNIQVIPGTDGSHVVKVLDFGLALALDQSELKEKSARIAGTLLYIAPEVLTGRMPSEAADLYAVGTIAYELLTGVYPFETTPIPTLITSILHKMPNFEPLAAHLPMPHQPMLDIIKRLMTKSPSERYTNAESLLHDLYQAAGQDSDAPRHESIAIRESFLQAAKFVGRAAELAQLTNAIHKVIDHKQGSAWLLVGESGVGKSRLMDEVRSRALVEGMIVLTGQAVQEGGFPYQLWREPLRRLLLTQAITDHDASILREIVPDIHHLLGRKVTAAAALDAKAAHERLTGTIYGLFRQQTEPILLIVEDIHWTSESLSVLQRLIDGVSELPLMILGSYRSDEQPRLPSELSSATVIPLNRLSQPEIQALSTTMLGEPGSQPQVIDLLQRETEGNVFFLVEVVRILVENAGQLSNIGAVTLPLSVFAGGMRQVIQRRLSRVEAWAQPLLQLAAIIGRQIDLTILQGLAERLAPENEPVPYKLEAWLQACADAAVIEIYDGQWRFAHDKLRESLLEPLTAEALKHAHRQAAHAIEAVYPNDANWATALAQHWGKAEDHDKERHYAYLAGKQAYGVCDYRAAEHFYKRVLALTPEANAYDRAEILLEVGWVLQMLSEYDPALEMAKAAQALRPQIDPLKYAALDVYALRLLATVADLQADYPKAIQYLEQALANTQVQDQGLSAQLLRRLAVNETRLGQYEAARAHLDQALALAEQVGDQALIVSTYSSQTHLAFRSGSPDEALTIALYSLQRHRDLKDYTGLCGALANIGLLYWSRGEFAQARMYLEEGAALTQQIGDMWGYANVLNTLGYVLTGLAESQAAWERFRAALKITIRLKADSLSLDILAGIAQLHEQEQRYEQAVELLGLALKHPACNTDVEQTVEPILERLRQHLPFETVEAALERGASLDLLRIAHTVA